MAFDATGLKRLESRGAVGTGVDSVAGHFAYDTADAAATVEAGNYFNAAAASLSKGSTIVASMVRSGTPVLKNYIVTANTGTVVTVALLTTTAG